MTPDDEPPVARPPMTRAKVLSMWCAGLLGVGVVLFLVALGNRVVAE